MYEETAWIVTPNSYEIFIGSSCGDIKDTNLVYNEIRKVTASW